jgi:hypothetical protein
MVAALLIPMVGPASASCTYSMTTTNSITPNSTGGVTSQHLGNLVVTFDVPTFQSATANKPVYFSLPPTPGGYMLYLDGATAASNLASELGVSTAVYTNMANALTVVNSTTLVGGVVTAGTGDNTTSEVTLNISNTVDSGNSIKLSSLLNLSGMQDVTLSIPMYVTIPAGTSGGPVTLTTNSQSTSVFTSGASITIANVKTPSVTLAAESAPALSTSGASIGTIDLKENTTGALQTSDNSPALSLTLPAGITWSGITANPMWGGSYNVIPPATTANPNPAPISYFAALTSPAANYTWTAQGSLAAGSGYIGYTTSANNNTELDFFSQNIGSSSGYFIKFNATVSIDSSTAAAGPINVTIGGEISSTVSTLTVGNYGSYGATTNASSTVPTIIAGKAASTVGELEIKESAPGSLISGRTIDLTLPSDVMWAQVPVVDPATTTNLGGLTGLSGSGASGWTAVGTTGNEIEATVGGTATTGNAADIFLKNIEVTPAVDFTGPVAVTIGGTEGLTGTATLANVAAGITAAAASTPTVQLGQPSETLGDLTISEAAAGNISATETDSYLNTTSGATNQYIALHVVTSSQADIDVFAPAGVTFFATPTVTVVSGNIQLGTVSTNTVANNQGELIIPIQNKSTSASVIKIAAPQVTIDNTVPNGPIIFKFKGTALDQTEMPATLPTSTTGQQLYPNDTTAASVTVANLGTAGTTTTAAPAGAVVFTIGQASYTVNGTVYNVDVAPFIKDSRTFLPLRAVAEALGVSDSNVLWDPATKKVTILQGSLVVQLTIGSTTMLLNGASITMDTTPEITGGRTCLPVAWVAKALGANITWDAASQTVTIAAE